MAAIKYDINKATIKRFLRTIIPQLPSLIAYIAIETDKLNAPKWIVPALVCLGAMITALDKFLRSVGFYEDVVSYVQGE